MIASASISTADLQRILKFDTCTVSNAIERLGGRLRNEGSIRGSVVRSIFPGLPPMLGYAVTARMRSTSPPVSGRAYHENMHWWRYVASMPEPRVMVVEDADDQLGAGAMVGELHALIGLALNCAGYVTNGSVRDLPAVNALRFPLFAGGVAVSHMYAHITGYGSEVEIGGLKINPGDLIHGDCHGVHTIPLSVARDIPETAEEILNEERQVRELCRSPRFSLRRLEKKLQEAPGAEFEMPLGEH